MAYKRPRVRKGYESSIYENLKYDIILKKPIEPSNYWVDDIEHQLLCRSREGVSFVDVSNFIERIVIGIFTRRICETLGFERSRVYLHTYWAERDEYLEEYGLPESLEVYLDILYTMCIDVLKEEYPLCIDLTSCGVLGDNPDIADIVIKVSEHDNDT